MAHHRVPPAPNGASKRTEPPPPQRPTVLLIEPDLATRQLYSRALMHAWQVIEAAHVDEARGHIANPPPAVVVLEPYAAGLGHEGDLERAWQFMQQAAAGPNGAPFVICSVVDERRTAYALGAALYLLKPVSPHQLVFELQRLLGAAATKEQLP